MGEAVVHLRVRLQRSGSGWRGFWFDFFDFFDFFFFFPSNPTYAGLGDPKKKKKKKKKKKEKSTPTPRTECPCAPPGGLEAPKHLTVRVQRSRIGWGTGNLTPGAPPTTVPEICPK